MKIGRFTLDIAWDGYFKLDGGAMFGVVPKPLWSRTDSADERNRILLSLNPLVIRFDSETFIVDTGMGDKWDEKSRDILGLDDSAGMLRSLEELGIRDETVTGVILTHLHFDHAGGAVKRSARGELIPTFPNARCYIQRREWDSALAANERTKASYLADNFLPLEEHGMVRFLDGDTEIVEGIRVEITGGHTPDHQLVMVESDEQKVCYVGDVIPTSSHIKLPYIMGYDTNPLDTLAVKKKILSRAVRENWLMVFPHSPRMRSGYLKDTDKGIILEPVDINGT